MPVPNIPDNSYVYIVCLGDVAGPMFLNSNTSNGSVYLTTQIGSAGSVDQSGSLWKANAIPSYGSLAYSFESLGSFDSPYYNYLEGRPDLSVGLSNAVGNFGSWNLIRPVRQTYFPMNPWSGSGNGPYFTFLLQCIGNTRYLNGDTTNGSVGLADIDISKPAVTGSGDNTGTRWAVMVPGYNP